MHTSAEIGHTKYWARRRRRPMNSKRDTIVKIALTGTTGSGKSTYVTTLCRRPAGEIANQAVTTLHARDWPLEHLSGEMCRVYATDCPGFETPAIMRMKLIASKAAAGDRSVVDKLQGDIEGLNTERDERALEAARNADVIVYVGCVMTVPKSTHENELAILHDTGKPIIGVLNMLHSHARGCSSMDHEKRVNQWIETIQVFACDDIVLDRFDAFWHLPSDIHRFFEIISNILPLCKRDYFLASLKTWKSEQDAVHAASHRIVARGICETRVKNVVIKQEEPKTDEYIEERKNELIASIEGAMLEALNELLLMHPAHVQPARASDYCTVFDTKKSRSLAKIVKAMAINTTSGATAGALLGAVIAAAALGSGLTAATIWISLKIAGTIGGVVSGVAGGVTQLSKTEMKISLTEENVRDLAAVYLAFVWSLLCHGFGRSPEIEIFEVEQIQQSIRKHIEEQNLWLDWLTEPEATIHSRVHDLGVFLGKDGTSIPFPWKST